MYSACSPHVSTDVNITNFSKKYSEFYKAHESDESYSVLDLKGVDDRTTMQSITNVINNLAKGSISGNISIKEWISNNKKLLDIEQIVADYKSKSWQDSDSVAYFPEVTSLPLTFS
jgi:hypothetical protein